MSRKSENTSTAGPANTGIVKNADYYKKNPDVVSFRKHFSRGKHFLNNQKPKEAIEEFQKAMSFRPDSIEAPLEYVKALYVIGEQKKAKAVLKTILACSWDVLNFAGYIYAREHEFEKAVKANEILKVLIPNEEQPRCNLGHYYLAVGNLIDGFREYGFRKKDSFYVNDKTKEWNGENIKGKRVLIYTEQGLGDIFEFIRYAKLVKENGGHVVLRLHKPFMKKYLSMLSYIDEISTIKEPLPECDYKTQIMSLPRVFETTVDTIPAPIPYLVADEKLVREWQKRLKSDTNFKVGLCWSGTTYSSNTLTRQKSARRSIALEKMAPLADVDGVTFYSLQKVKSPDELKTSVEKFVVHGFGDDFDKTHGSFMDTAAIMKALDLIITVDTSVAHVAGGLGVPVWIILPYESEWRWLEERSDSPWYPTARLFRTKELEKWEPVIDNVKAELKKLLNK